MPEDTILDLDALAPQPRQVKLGGKTYECYPPKVRQMIRMQQVWEDIQNNPSSQDAEKLLREVLAPIFPAIEKDPDLDISYEQMAALLSFAQGIAVPEKGKEGAETAEQFPVKKKEDTPKE